MKYYFSFRTDSITTCPPSDSATGLTGGPLPGLCGSVHHTDPLQDTSDVKLILDLRGTTRTPHVDHFKLTLPLCQHLPPPPVVQTCPARSSGCRTPQPSRPVSTRPPRTPPAQNQAGTSAWRQQNSSKPGPEPSSR